ncbi:MAG: DUF1223 domain-containing protein [Parasphingorhabdus sp.]|uniref:DUF1223 domain-containing protein n=1 Tax=Parasphingorhabdus sp. TaxID=2709688 RepID=UPI003298D926
MRYIILPAMIAATAFAGFMGAQIAQSSSGSSAQVATPANNFDDATISPTPTVVELFTSQGCSSCPPADMLASRLAKDSSLLVISRPVTYWDRLGWKDTLAREQNTRLQRTYARKGKVGSGVYTPQIVVNGGGGAVGSREGDVRSLVRLAKNNSGPLIETNIDENGFTTVTISGQSRYMAGVALLALSSSETVSVGRGENGGRKLHYTNVVKAERNLGSWDGSSTQFTLSHNDLNIPGADKYAIIVQRPGAGVIVGAKLLEI